MRLLCPGRLRRCQGVLRPPLRGWLVCSGGAAVRAAAGAFWAGLYGLSGLLGFLGLLGLARGPRPRRVCARCGLLICMGPCWAVRVSTLGFGYVVLQLSISCFLHFMCLSCLCCGAHSMYMLLGSRGFRSVRVRGSRSAWAPGSRFLVMGTGAGILYDVYPASGALACLNSLHG